jgi:hypothetical protein
MRWPRYTASPKATPIFCRNGANQRSGGVADRLGVKVQTIAPLRSSPIKKGMIYSPAHGDTAFTVPLFDQFMLRTMPQGPRKATV